MVEHIIKSLYGDGKNAVLGLGVCLSICLCFPFVDFPGTYEFEVNVTRQEERLQQNEEKKAAQ